MPREKVLARHEGQDSHSLLITNHVCSTPAVHKGMTHSGMEIQYHNEEKKTDMHVISSVSGVSPLSRPGHEINDQGVYRRTLVIRTLYYPCSLVTFVVPSLPLPSSV